MFYLFSSFNDDTKSKIMLDTIVFHFKDKNVETFFKISCLCFKEESHHANFGMTIE